MKRRIRLTESDLHRIVKESVNRVLNEIGDTRWNEIENEAKSLIANFNYGGTKIDIINSKTDNRGNCSLVIQLPQYTRTSVGFDARGSYGSEYGDSSYSSRTSNEDRFVEKIVNSLKSTFRGYDVSFDKIGMDKYTINITRNTVNRPINDFEQDFGY